ncbi:hypothetical protein ABZY19_32585 [Streptomyces sp. NPDC006475]|uniref:DUF4760 domain-containing protein n=1 Tax=Streptomyces sp. NPDC006475 TaxID=3155719 RepID=UPI00339FC10A
MNVAALILSIAALVVSVLFSYRRDTLARHANTLPVLVDFFSQHRSDRLADARDFVYKEMSTYDLSQGLAGLPEERRTQVRELAWFYDNLGALVTHKVVDIKPVSGYLGVSVVLTWEKLEPLIKAERAARTPSGVDPERWQVYFENLYLLVKRTPPAKARESQRRWIASRTRP